MKMRHGGCEEGRGECGNNEECGNDEGCEGKSCKNEGDEEINIIIKKDTVMKKK